MTADRPERPERQESPPPLRSQQHPRTRPHRRRPVFRAPSTQERRRAQLNRWTLVFGVLVGITAIFAALLARDTRSSPPDVGPEAPTEAVAVSVVDIVDGDTLHVEDAGGEVLTVRLFGIDTPERGEACYGEATDRLRELAGDTVLLLPDERLQDDGGRELRYVFTEDGASIDAALLDEGLAVAWRRDGVYRDELVALEEEAANDGAGCLWDGG